MDFYFFIKYPCLKYLIFVIIIKKYGMRKFCLILFSMFLCIDFVSAASRSQNTSVISTSRQASTRTRNETVSRSVSSRDNTDKSTNARSATARSATNRVITGRSAINKTPTRTPTVSSRLSRAAATTQTKTFGTNYNSCRDAYFTCMDQFCATQNETYRRCVCSSKLKDIQNTETLLSQTANNLKDFEDLNIDSISKTSNEVQAMLSATEGESAIKIDKSESSTTLQNISNVLNSSKQQSLSTQGKLDIAGDIKAVWSTTSLIGGADIANLTGEALFNAVHTQCAELVTASCASSDLKMVSSAYGMYIENDCAVLENNINAKKTAANATIRSTRHKMQDARLENYDSHNSLNVTDCIANVRKDIISDTACGNGYIHCLDFSGKYLNITTGEPIYSPEFYQIENQISLSGDVLKESENATFITMLNKKRPFAETNLSLCQDNADEVWNEFLRQALVEIYQAQQARVKSVKDECLEVVNKCYTKQSESLQNFSGNDTQISKAITIELTEEMCKEKLDTCSNLYGGGSAGLNTLIATMTGINDLTIEQSCSDLLNAFALNICAVEGSDSAHSYPYGCRKYNIGESRYARVKLCNDTLVNPFSKSNILSTEIIYNDYSDYLGFCENTAYGYQKIYTSCKNGYYLYNPDQTVCDATNLFCYNADEATACRKCPNEAICMGGTDKPISIDAELSNQCGAYYVGSLYQQFVLHALQNCTRSTDESHVLSETLLSEVDAVVKSVRASLVSELSKECQAQNGIWVDIPWIDENGDGIHDSTIDILHVEFYTSTGADTSWGYCREDI